MALVQNILSLEVEADLVVAQARAEAKEVEQSAIVEVEAYRRQSAEETATESFCLSNRDGEKASTLGCRSPEGAVQALDAIDQIAGGVLKEKN